ncbi:MAG: 5-(carboxyamino)imidazole ribonucleotide mutase [Clostridiales bacterium]|jgi:5-(carboxyamino)imidazole ribonucleotide mutase|nr:5-(carboxyamino)imidazole ribonucleotide mutase [Clostridiales bacterium]
MRKVIIAMGSDSDLPVMAGAAQALETLGIGFEIRIVSAHRTPEAAADLARNAADRGFGVIIAGAGGAAHLAGVLASHTVLPVIGVPVTSRLSGLDSLLSTVQMPQGIPVACVAVDGAFNAGLLAAQILAVGDENLTRSIVLYKEKLFSSVVAKDEEIQKIGYSLYLDKKKQQ